MTPKHKFTIRIGDDIITYDNYADIPDRFDNLIAFNPYIPLGPHSDEDHAEIENWMEKFMALREREDK